MRILIIQNNHFNLEKKYTDRHLQKIKNVDRGISVNLINYQKEVINKYLPETNILICPRFGFYDLVDLSVAKKLKWVHVTSAGVNSLLKFFKKVNILLTNSSGVHPIPIAEHVFAFLLMFTRQLNKTYRQQIQSKKWLQNSKLPKPVELHNKTIGIVGYGRVGKRIAKISRAFDMKIITLTYSQKVEDINIDRSYFPEDINKLLKKSDVVVNCLPLTRETKDFFDFEKFKRMKKSAYFINIGRGKTVKEKHLIRALKQKLILAADLVILDLAF
ncbi:MAG: hypothetical protein GXO93_09005, partial [FCB group bacterium]|nr:hypothetical protein [FCB group bacterium]